MAQKRTINQKRKMYAMTKVDLRNFLQKQFDQYDASLELVHHSIWQIRQNGQVTCRFLMKNSKNWVNDDRAIDLKGHYAYRSWNTLASDDMHADVDYYVFTISQRRPKDAQLVVLTPAQMKKLYQDPRRVTDKRGLKHFYFSKLMNGRVGDSRFAKRPVHNYAGWIDLPKSVWNNYALLVGNQ